MKIKLQNGMKFQSLDGKSGFYIKKVPFYDDTDEPVWCAFTENVYMPLSEIILSSYIPQVNGIWINEPNEYEE